MRDIKHQENSQLRDHSNNRIHSGTDAVHFPENNAITNFATCTQVRTHPSNTRIVHISHLGDYLQGIKSHDCNILVENNQLGAPIANRLEMKAQEERDTSSQAHASTNVGIQTTESLKAKKEPIHEQTSMGKLPMNGHKSQVWELKENIASVLMHLKQLDLPRTSPDKVERAPCHSSLDTRGCHSKLDTPAYHTCVETAGCDSSLDTRGCRTCLDPAACRLTADTCTDARQQQTQSVVSNSLSEQPDYIDSNRFLVTRKACKCNEASPVTTRRNPTTTLGNKCNGSSPNINRAEGIEQPRTPPAMSSVDKPRPSARLRRDNGPRRRALVVGCTYVGDSEAALRGSCNDAFLFATLLVSHLGFEPEDVLLLIDAEPAQVYLDQAESLSKLPQWSRCQTVGTRSNSRGILGLFGKVFNDDYIEKEGGFLEIPTMLALDSPGEPFLQSCQPTRANILRGLRWLTQNTKPGDCGVFYFSGHGIQLDDLSGWEGEGYEEGLVPCDYRDHDDPSKGIIPAMQIKRMIQGVDKCCQMTLVLDAVGLQTMLDPVGCVGHWKYIKGAVLRGIWPLADATGKVKRADYNTLVWRDGRMQSQMVRPKFLPLIEVDCVSNLLDGFVGAASPVAASVNAACISAAPWQDTAIEALFKPLDLGTLPKDVGECKSVVVHGVFTYCLALTLVRDIGKRGLYLTFNELQQGINKRLLVLKRTRLPLLNQTAEVTIHSGGLASLDDFFAHVWGGKVPIRISSLNPFAKLGLGSGAFLKLPDAWMQLHDQGRAIAMEHRERFGRMRTAALGNENRMFTVDINQSRRNSSAMGKWPQGPQIVEPFAAQHPPMQHVLPPPPYPMHSRQPPSRASSIHTNPPRTILPATNWVLPSPSRAPAPQQVPHNYQVPEARRHVPYQIPYSCHNQQMPLYSQGYMEYVPIPVPPRQATSVPVNKPLMPQCRGMHYPRSNTSHPKPNGINLAEPITAALLSQLPIRHF
ncbi:hypothetical protein BdWA1_001439 [Babesia duncani]|uniref:Peptidase C14 caspase domain-containing protein n=1 Tax=Babesia duncani TaxID=323732 RepID=A0AAD9PP20_9APIC|nr:hypothetical protein BdWA1_001439 [Babesia duncani]